MQGVLLSDGNYYGTLAAARSLRGKDIPIVLMGNTPWTFTNFSNAITSRINSPDPTSLDEYTEWLLKTIPQYKGYHLYPTSDDMCWIVSKNIEEISKYLVTSYPSIKVIRGILDKKQLYDHMFAKGIETIPTKFPRNAQELISQSKEIPLPILMKPRTQIGLLGKRKGLIINSYHDLDTAWEKFKSLFQFSETIIRDIPDINQPMIQHLYSSAAEKTYSISGYISRQDNLNTMQASVKMKQIPPQIGVGMCFESASLDQELANKIAFSCKDLGYFGIFEAEFIPTTVDNQEKLMLMDFNPRYYGQMAFQIGRGLDLPYFPILETSEQSDKLTHYLNEKIHNNDHKYCHKSLLAIMLKTQKYSSNLSESEYLDWVSWISSRPELMIDAIQMKGDPKPEIFELVNLVFHAIKHPRSTWRTYFT